MDWKSIGLVRTESPLKIIQVWMYYHLLVTYRYFYDVPNILLLSHLLYFNLLPQSITLTTYAVTNIFSLTPEIPLTIFYYFFLFISLQSHLFTILVDILLAYVHDLYSQPLLVSVYPYYHMFVLLYPYTLIVSLTLVFCTYTLFTILNVPYKM